jgi:hypothetical protein
MKNKLNVGDTVVIGDSSKLFKIISISNGIMNLKDENGLIYSIFYPSDYMRLTKVPEPRKEKNMAPKFNIDDKVFRKKYRTNTPSTITTVTKSGTGRFLYLLDNDTYDNHCKNDWEDEFDLVHENEYPAFVEREKQTKIREFRDKIAQLEKQIQELETP